VPQRLSSIAHPPAKEMSMPKLIAAAATFALSVALALPTAAHAQGPIESYNARLSAQDHYNSNGVRLRSVAAIIRQDRARYHRFGSGDREDDGDRFFASAANRARLEALVARGRMGPGVAGAIVNGTPYIHVDIYPGYVNVTVD
jgi:hypothetical protein